MDLTYPYEHAGTGRRSLGEVLDSDHGEAAGKATVIVVGQGALTGGDGAAVLGAVMRMAGTTQSKLLVLHTAASRVGAMDLGCVTEGGIAAALGAEVIHNLGRGRGGDPGRAVRGLPGQPRRPRRAPGGRDPAGGGLGRGEGIFVNTEGRPQMANRAGFPPGEARENWAILRALSAVLGKTLPFDSLAALRGQMLAAVPHLGRIDVVPENPWTPVEAGAMSGADFRSGGDAALSRQPGDAGERGDGGADAAGERTGRSRWRRSRGHGVLQTRLRAVPPDPRRSAWR